MTGARLGWASLSVAFLLVGCFTYRVSLDNPLRYREIPAAERLPMRCYFSLDPQSASQELEEGKYRVAIGAALASQIRTGLSGRCRGGGRVGSVKEFAATRPKDAAILLQIQLERAALEPVSAWGFSAENAGSIAAVATIAGRRTGTGTPIQYRFEARRTVTPAFRESQEGYGAEGLREALGAAVQSLLDRALEDRERLAALATSE